MSGRQFTTNDIHLALDGELSADDRADFDRWMDTHPEMRALSARYARDRATLVAALAPVLDEPVPPRLTATALGEA
jgi:anti-sigma factor RsiW